MYITHEPISLQDFFSFPIPVSAGALSSFVGIVRNHSGGKKVKELYYECYPSMANRMLENIISQARGEWETGGVSVIHRVGRLRVGEAAVAIAVASSHRDESFKACRFIIESIKKNVPIWKKEIFEDGSSEWGVCSHQEPVLL